MRVVLDVVTKRWSIWLKKVGRQVWWKGMVVALIFVVVGCGGTTEPPKEKTFKQLTSDEKLVFMGTKVFAPLKGLFQTHNAERYKSFACGTCHGQNHSNYKMPSGIFPMDPANPLKDDDATYGKSVVFMKQQVLPKMKELLQDNSLTCFTCHGKK